MAFTEKVLADGQLSNTKGTIYTVPGATATYVKGFRLFNTGATSETVKLYIKPGATSRQVIQAVVGAKETLIVIEPGETWLLEAGDLIEGETTNATTVDYVIMGIEKA